MDKKYNGTQWEPKPFGYQHSSKYLMFHRKKRKSCRFETTWRWGWTIPFTLHKSLVTSQVCATCKFPSELEPRPMSHDRGLMFWNMPYIGRRKDMRSMSIWSSLLFEPEWRSLSRSYAELLWSTSSSSSTLIPTPKLSSSSFSRHGRWGHGDTGSCPSKTWWLILAFWLLVNWQTLHRYTSTKKASTKVDTWASMPSAELQ